MGQKSNHNFYNKRLKPLASNLRNHSTLSEITLWNHLLRARQLKGYQFLRQRPIGRFIADFFCKELKLIIELDGLTHEEKVSEDKIRQTKLEKLGFAVIRFNDAEVIESFEAVKNKLEKWIEEFETQNPNITKYKVRRKLPSPSPPSKGE